MPDSEILLDYHGQIDLKVIDKLLKNLRKVKGFNSLNTITRKRVYSLVVECLENIYKYAILPEDTHIRPRISVSIVEDKICIVAGNPVMDGTKESLAGKIDYVNSLSEEHLKKLYAQKLNREPVHEENGAGLGLIFMLLKSENKLNYSFKPLVNGYSYFEIIILINKNIMRKLIIEKTSSTPKVILDPEKKIYLISGESRPPDVREFYGQIMTWIQEFSTFLLNPDYNKEPVVFNFDFEYFNSSSGKLILDICKVLASLRLKGINLTVKWYFEKEDGDMLEVGKEMSRIVKFPFEFVESEIN